MPTIATNSWYTHIAGQIGIPVRTQPMVLATTATQKLFLSTGPVLITGLIGLVTTVFDAAASLVHFWVNADGATDISAASGSLTAAAAGTFVYITGVFGTATPIVKLVPVSCAAQTAGGMVVDTVYWPGGTYLGETTTTGQTTGQMQFALFYVPLTDASYVTAVA